MDDLTQYDLYNESKSSNYVLGFHGCYTDVAEALLSTDIPDFKPSENDYDWLGHGLYFWENDPYRAKQFIEEKIQRLKKKGSAQPKHNLAVIGAVLDLGYCLNLVENQYISLINQAYLDYLEVCKANDAPVPENRSAHFKDHDRLLRHKDCAVIQFLHASQQGSREFDTVRGMFTEGNPVYEGSGFQTKTHVQIAVRNPKMIKGYFRPILTKY